MDDLFAGRRPATHASRPPKREVGARVRDMDAAAYAQRAAQV